MFQFSFVFQGDGDAVLGEAMDEVGGAVQGVDHPLKVCPVTLAADFAGFLGENAVIRVGLEDDFDDALFGSPVPLGDEVVHAFLADR